MKRLSMILGLALMVAACEKASESNIDIELPVPQESGTMTVFASVEEGVLSRVSISAAGAPAWQEGDKIALYNGTAFVEFSLTDASTGAFSGPADNYTGLAVYPASIAGSVDGSGQLSLDLPAQYSWQENQTSAPMIAVSTTSEFRFYPLTGMLRHTFTDIPADATEFHFSTGSKLNGTFNIGVPAPGTSAIIRDDAANDAQKVITISIPSGHPSTMSFYIPIPVYETGYNGFSVSVSSNDGVPAAEIGSSKTVTIARGQMQPFKSTSCADALPGKIYLIGDCLTPTWTWSDDNALVKGTGAVYQGKIHLTSSSGGFKMYLNNDWSATWLSIDQNNSSAGNLIVVGGEAYKAAHGVGDTQVYPSVYGYNQGEYDVTLDLSAKRLIFDEVLYLVGSPFSWGWTFDGTNMSKVAPNVYRATNVDMNFDNPWNGFRIYTKKELWNELYTYNGGGSDSSGILLEYWDQWGDPAQIFPGQDFGYTTGTYDIEFNTSTLRLILTKK